MDTYMVGRPTPVLLPAKVHRLVCRKGAYRQNRRHTFSTAVKEKPL
jgi:hypothetical protein